MTIVREEIYYFEMSKDGRCLISRRRDVPRLKQKRLNILVFTDYDLKRFEKSASDT